MTPELISQDRIDQLATDIAEWLLSTGTTKTTLHRAASMTHGTMLNITRREYGVRASTEKRLRDCMAANPDGIKARPQRKKAVSYGEPSHFKDDELQRRRDEVEAARLARHKALMEAERAQLSAIGRAKFSAKPVWEMVA